jgi:SAM-dependent methyltransferase
MSPSRNIDTCRTCGGTGLTRVMDFGPQFLATLFVRDNDAVADSASARVPLSVVLCSSCGLLQLEQTVDRSQLFSDYFYRSGTNPMMGSALKEIADAVSAEVEGDGGVFLDIGCNDGTLLSFVPTRFRRIGVEPVKNIDWDHLDPSITVVNDFFSSRALLEATDGEKCKAVTSIAMLYSVDKLNAIVSEIQSVLADDGVWCIQVSYLPAMLESLCFYDVCHEHLYYFSLDSLSRLIEGAGLKIVDGSLNDVNGGSLRVLVVHKDNPRAETPRLQEIRATEAGLALQEANTYRRFFRNVVDLKERTREFLCRAAEKDDLIIGLGASTKGNVLLQFFDIDKKLLSCISDRNPEKVSLRTLGTDIEVVSEADARAMKPAFMLVLIWFFKDEVVRREREFLDNGGKLIFPMPYLHVVSRDGEERL